METARTVMTEVALASLNGEVMDPKHAREAAGLAQAAADALRELAETIDDGSDPSEGMSLSRHFHQIDVRERGQS